MFLSVLEVVLRVGQDLKEGLDKLLVLQKRAGGSRQHVGEELLSGPASCLTVAHTEHAQR